VHADFDTVAMTSSIVDLGFEVAAGSSHFTATFCLGTACLTCFCSSETHRSSRNTRLSKVGRSQPSRVRHYRLRPIAACLLLLTGECRTSLSSNRRWLSEYCSGGLSPSVAFDQTPRCLAGTTWQRLVTPRPRFWLFTYCQRFEHWYSPTIRFPSRLSTSTRLPGDPSSCRIDSTSQ
jgi:hypothetical protein